MKKGENKKPKIIGKKIGQKIEQTFAKKFQRLNETGEPFTLLIEEIKKKIPEYSSGNGHSALRNQERGGKSIGYLPYEYNVEKIRKGNDNINSEITELKISKKGQ